MALRAKIILLVFLSSFAVVAGTLVTVYQLYLNSYETLIAEREEAEISRLSTDLELSLQQRFIALETFAPRLLENGELRSPAEITTLLEQAEVIGALFSEGLLVFDTDATAIAEKEFVPDRVGTNYADRPHFQRYMEILTPIVSEPIIGRTTGLPLLSFLVPVFSQAGEHKAIMGGTIDLSVSALLPDEQSHHDSEVLTMVVDPQHHLFVELKRPIEQPESLPPAGENALVDAVMTLAPTGSTVEHNGTRYLIATSPLESLGWHMLRAVPLAEALAPARASFRQLVAISLAVVLVMAGIGWWIAGNITRPLDQLTRKINHMAAGELSTATLPERGGAEVRALAGAMNRLTEERHRVDMLKDDFVSTVSHELRTPLTSIHGALKVVDSGASGEVPAEARKMVGLASRNSERLLALIQDLLDFNKLLTDQVALQPEPCDLRAIADEAVTDLSAADAAASVRIEVAGPEAAPVEGDPARIRQVLDNLLSNALKHSPHGGRVEVRIEVDRSGCWRLTVSDQGAGVPDSFKDRIFQRFAQAEQGNTRTATGTGLGLAISRELVLRMKGDIGYRNRNGAHFWFELPQTNS